MLIAATLFIVAPLNAQGVAPAAACSFDTAAHTDTLSLQFAIRVFRDGDDAPDARMTRVLGDLLRSSFRPPPSIGAIFAPNTYFAQEGEQKQHFSEVLGSARLHVQPSGAIAWDWPFPMADSATQRAVDAALAFSTSSESVRQVFVYNGWKKAQTMQMQLVALTDDIPAGQAALLRVRVPMLRIEGDSVDQVFTRGKPETLHPARGYDKLRSDGWRPLVIDGSGHLTVGGPEVEWVIARGSSQTTIRNGIAFAPARVGDCPVPFGLRAIFSPRP